EADRKAWQNIRHLVRRVAPFVKELSPVLVGSEEVPAVHERDIAPKQKARLDWIDERDRVFGPHHLSDGTLRFIALVTALAQPTHRRPSFISIDEPELGLHPAALGLLIELVKSVSIETQVVLATQSPTVLDAFEPEDVVVVERADAETRLRRLDPDQLAAWLEDYSLSELYDKNV